MKPRFFFLLALAGIAYAASREDWSPSSTGGSGTSNPPGLDLGDDDDDDTTPTAPDDSGPDTDSAARAATTPTHGPRGRMPASDRPRMFETQSRRAGGQSPSMFGSHGRVRSTVPTVPLT